VERGLVTETLHFHLANHFFFDDFDLPLANWAPGNDIWVRAYAWSRGLLFVHYYFPSQACSFVGNRRQQKPTTLSYSSAARQQKTTKANTDE
jgi:hypothetical protein